MIVVGEVQVVGREERGGEFVEVDGKGLDVLTVILWEEVSGQSVERSRMEMILRL